MSQSHPIACQHHNHQRCIEDAVATARHLCQIKGVRLTPLREQVLILIWQSHHPLGAYALMDMLAAQTTRRVAPPTVYRALEFLLNHRFIHRINCLNAFIGCPDAKTKHENHFLICQACGVASECNRKDLAQVILQTADAAGFLVENQMVEIVGLCPCCRENNTL